MEPAASETLAQWLLGSIELDAAALHVGRYCGPWRASTADRGLASFHLVLHGDCYLHVAGQAPLKLRARDGVFLMREVAHFLSPSPDPGAIVGGQEMLPLAAAGAGPDGGAGLACGFFRFGGTLSSLVIDSFPEYLVCRSGDPALRHSAALFDLILAEAGGDPERPSPLIARLVELLFFYLIRHAAQCETVSAGLLALAQRGEFVALLDEMLRHPGEDWSIARMARAVHMSRAAFCKHFSSVGGLPPAQFLLRLRMTAAAGRLRAGDSVEQAAGHVGYQSSAAFTRAFKRIVGAQPGSYRRQLRAAV
ncbi:cupin domain-containing protein [Rugamonas sp. CCM 8940]|uniref:AraC family transcriptional regulator n=1 Tax=Rugamonas sp. CCM 8940 TaxID=2765359 RepID=UPI0018F61546|nr:AraC family transcriptional regulator [Rugamonas sp. CCM 8940]MBJ7311120.1 AraC family transcriptional regulator [Rugamonas sp. CCM 8940]